MKKVFLLALAIRLLLSFGSYHPDLGNHLDWGIKFWSIGPSKLYEYQFWQVSWLNQPPGTAYLFALVRKIYEGVFGLFWFLNLKIPLFPSSLIPFLEEKLYVSLIKLPSILADLGIAVLIYRLVKKMTGERWAKRATAIFLFNPIVFYTSAVWGQTDSIINFLALWAFYLFFRQKAIWATLVYFLSLYFKGSLLIFLPVVLILLWRSKEKWWSKISVLLAVPVLLAYLSFPFVRWHTPIVWLYHLYVDRILGHQGNMLTANAFNLWAIFFGIDFTRNDLGTLWGVSLKIWGQFLFLLSSIPAILVLLRKKVTQEAVFRVLVVITFASFVFLTNMHERYLYPVFPYLTILLFLPSMPFFYGVLSLVFFLNLYHLWYIPGFWGLKAIYTPATIKFFSFLNLALFLFFFCHFFWSEIKKINWKSYNIKATKAIGKYE
jgi:Gpi18-like mannosyltransferase